MSSATKPPIALKGRRARPAEPSPIEAPPPPPTPAPDPSLPVRITLRRIKGWRMPEGAVVVTRGGTGRGPWGNPFRIMDAPEGSGHPYWVVWSGCGCGTRRPRPAGWRPVKCDDRRRAQEEAVAAFSTWLAHPDQGDVLRGVREHLRGKVLACFCSQASPCHADVLLELANAGSEATP